MEVKLQEKYNLSSQYTLENLMQVYRDSMLMEIQKYSHVLYSMLKQAKIAYPGPGCMALEVGDTVLYRDMQGELIRILEKIIVERCGISASLSLEFVEKENNRHREEDELMIRRKVEEISRKAAEASAQRSEGAGENTQEAVKADSKEAAKKMGEKKENAAKSDAGKGKSTNANDKISKDNKGKDGKADYRKPQSMKRSDNPDVIYGRDFEDEAMPISEIIGEIGEVTIRGQIIALDTREIRNEKTIL